MACSAEQIDILGKCCKKDNIECIQAAISSKKPDPNTLDYIVQILSTLGTIAPSVITSIKQNASSSPSLPTIPERGRDVVDDDKDSDGKKEDSGGVPIWVWILIGVAVVSLIVFIIIKNKKKQ